MSSILLLQKPCGRRHTKEKRKPLDTDIKDGYLHLIIKEVLMEGEARGGVVVETLLQTGRLWD
jgi:hypothetical protein